LIERIEWARVARARSGVAATFRERFVRAPANVCRDSPRRDPLWRSRATPLDTRRSHTRVGGAKRTPVEIRGRDRASYGAMKSAYAVAKQVSKTSRGLREGRLDASWYQGRGVFGGLLAAILLEAVGDEVADGARPPRSITLHFAAPATEGPFEVATEIVREGSRVTHARAELRRDGAVTTFATASFCASRASGSPRYAHARAPDVPPARESAPFPRSIPGVPAFFDHVDARFVGPSVPFTGSKTPAVAAWVRLVEPAPIDAPLAALLLDSLPPAITSTFTAPRPVASVDFTVRLYERLPRADVRPDDHLLVSIASRWADDGYTEEVRDLWTPGGILLGECRQLLAVL
jgi:acyl-CoA thioesterase